MEDRSEETIDTSTKSSFSAKPRAIDRPMSAIKRMMMEKKSNPKKDQSDTHLCPFSGCGRRFVSQEQLQSHIDRKHQQDESKKDETKVVKPVVSNPQGTPVRTLSKKVQEVPGAEQQRILNDIMGKKSTHNKPKDYRPMTSFVPSQQRNSGFKYIKDVQPHEFESKPAKKVARPQTAVPKSDGLSLLERDQFLQSKLKALEDIENKLDSDISSFKYQNLAKTQDSEQSKGIVVTKDLLLEKSNCDELRQIECLILRDCKIRTFDTTNQVDLNQLVNLE